MYTLNILFSHDTNTENGEVELNWYEIGRVLTVNNGTDYVYVGDIDIWPGM